MKKLLMVIVLSMSVSAGATTIVADSSTDWANHVDSNGVGIQGHSDTSGLGQWYYGYYDGDVSGGENWTPADFEQTTSLWSYGIRQAVPGTYCLLGQAFVHPDDYYAPVRRWVSGIDGNIVISGNVTRQATDTNCTYFRVYADDNIVLGQLVTSNTPVVMNSSFSVTKGSIVDFVIYAYDGIQNDGANFQATISVPEPSVLGILMAGVIPMLYKARRRIG